MAGVNSIIARKLVEQRLSKIAKHWQTSELGHVESEIMMRKMFHEKQLIQELETTHISELALRRRCVKKKCFCPYHLSLLIKEHKIGVCA